MLKEHHAKTALSNFIIYSLFLNKQDMNTEVCEQLFSWLSKFAPITKHMNRWRFLFLMLYLVDNHNHDVERGGSWSS